MSSFVVMTGNLTRDPEVRYLDGGKAVTNFTVALNERGKDGKEYTSFIRCSAWGELAIRVGDQARKGSRVVVEGKLSQRTWTDNKDQKHDEVSVVVRTASIVLKQPPAASDPQQVDDDLPF
jgi:single-strand DNA-binding protein